METGNRKKLLLVMRPAAEPDAALIDRARLVALALELDILVYCPVVTPYIANSGAMSGLGPPPAAIEESSQLASDYTERVTAAFAERGTTVKGLAGTCVSEIAGTLAQAGAASVAMVMVNAEQYQNWSDSLLQSSELARFEVPVWIHGTGQGEGIVLAAVDTGDREITTQARHVAERLNADIHLVHAVPPRTALDLALEVAASSDTPERIETNHVADIYNSAHKADIPHEHIHIQHGDPVQAIVDVAKTMRASVIVMGAANTSPLARIFLRSREQKLVGRLDADVLLVANR